MQNVISNTLIVILVLLVLMACEGPTPGSDNSGSKNGAPQTYYNIFNKSGALGLQRSKTVLLKDAGSQEYPQWLFIHIKTNCYRILSSESAFSLKVQTGTNQENLWNISDCGGGRFKITSLDNGKALTVSNLGSIDGVNTEEYTGKDSQKWSITPLNTSNSCAVWLTKADTSALLERKPDAGFSDQSESVKYLFNVDDDISYQQMDGFGASLTETSAYLIYNKLSEQTRNALMTNLFDPDNGIGISFLRQPMGSSDFALSHYSYDDMPSGKTDPELKGFNIDRDKKAILPLLRLAQLINPSIKIMASPWSPPGWMKSGGIMIGGSLNQSSYSVYADYFVKFIKAYEAEGIPIYAVTPQNEPLLLPPNYSGMLFPAESELNFIKNYLGPAFKTNGLSTKIICWDFNWDNTSYATTILSDSNASLFIAGSAWHYYEGKPDAMTAIHNAFPDKDIWQTEGGSGRWIASGTFRGTFKEGMKQAIRITRNWSKTVVWWNIALNEGNGPMVFANDWNYGLVQIREGNGTITYPYRSGYYSIAHFSKFVRPGAFRIECPSFPDQVEAVAFKNPDKSVVLVVFNTQDQENLIRVQWKGQSFRYLIPAISAATFVWK